MLSRHRLVSRQAVDLLVLSLLLSSLPLLGQEPTINRDQEKQIHEFHRHLPNYNRGGQDLLVVAAASPNKRGQIAIGPPMMAALSAEDANGELIFDRDVCRADAVVIGHVISFKVLLSADNSSVFRDYRIALERVVENKSRVPLETRKAIVVAVMGGTFISGDLRVEQSGYGRPGPLIPSEEYLLLLKALSNNASFSIAGHFGIEYIDSTGFHAVTTHPLRDNVNRFLETLPVDSIDQHMHQVIQKCESIKNADR